MNSYYKYILFFILGVIIYYFFKDNLIEGNIFDDISDNSDSINRLKRGCINYTCESDPNTYDNYQKKINPDIDSNPFYNTCSNLSEEHYIHSNPNMIPCSNEICCENRICKSSDISCGPNEIFLPNNHCMVGLNNTVGCNSNVCCQPYTDDTVSSEWTEYTNKNCYGNIFNLLVSDNSAAQTGNPTEPSRIHDRKTLTECKEICNNNPECDCIAFNTREAGVMTLSTVNTLVSMQTRGYGNCYLRKSCNIEECEDSTDFNTHIYSSGGIFENIINFRNTHGGNKNNGDNITGEDIRNYLYYSLLDLISINRENSPLEYNVNLDNNNFTYRYYTSSGDLPNESIQNWTQRCGNSDISQEDCNNPDLFPGITTEWRKNRDDYDTTSTPPTYGSVCVFSNNNKIYTDEDVPSGTNDIKITGKNNSNVDVLGEAQCSLNMFKKILEERDKGVKVVPDGVLSEENCQNPIIKNTSDYPEIGKKIALKVIIPPPNDECYSGGSSTNLKNVSFKYVETIDDIYYQDYEELSNWISNLEDTELETKLFLKNEDTRDLTNFNDLLSLIDNDKFNIDTDTLTTLDLKKLIKNLDKILDYDNIKLKPLDRFFHTSINDNKNSLINKELFLGLMNQ